MSQNALFMRMMCSSITIANHAGIIIRDIMKKGELGIIEKVFVLLISYRLKLKKLIFQFYVYNF